MENPTQFYRDKLCSSARTRIANYKLNVNALEFAKEKRGNF